MAQELITFVQHIYGFRMKQVVLDFIKDCKGNYVLTDIKNFTFDEHEKIRYLKFKDEKPEERSKSRQALIQKAQITASCSLCKAGYAKHQIQNTITKRMLYKLNSHLTKRGVFLLQNLDKFQY